MHKFSFIFLICALSFSPSGQAQYIMDMFDTSDGGTRGKFSPDNKFNHVRVSGYLQTQFQVAQSKGINSYAGGDFSENSDNRFMIRRGRVRFDYASFTEDDLPSLHFVFQFNGSERGVEIRDFWGRIYENKLNVFSLTAGMFARPFGYEVNLSSSDRESPERGRMSQILMKTERDLGAMISYEPQQNNHPLKFLKVDAGIFNGQGLTSPGDYDSFKDFISRASIKPLPINKNLSISGGLSYFNGGFIQNNKYVNEIKSSSRPIFVTDSSISNINKKAPRKYYAADIQLKLKSNIGITEIRAEYWKGKQTATSTTSETPATILNEPYFIRNFDGAFFYLLHKFNGKHQVALKLDFFDPNTKVTGKEIGSQFSNLNSTDIKYTTIGAGYIYYFNKNAKLILWYDVVTNENTLLTGYSKNIKDNVFTCRLQFKF